jgi:aminoglycoside/choline kinase family phosphotransferase
MIQHLRTLAESYYNSPCSDVEKIPQSGSARAYHRFFFEHFPSLIGVFNADVKENEAFFSFTNSFLALTINVPQIVSIDENRKYYLLQDLGNETLFSYLTTHNTEPYFHQQTLDLYKKVLQQLPLLQLSSTKGLDFSVCYPRAAFDKQSMLWDLNYFKYYYLKLAHIHFDEQLLEDDFSTFIDFLLKAEGSYFMFRDFQSRNIMICNEEPYFIDYQGGRRGALQYDLASLLYDGKANLPQEIRNNLYEFYLSELSKHIPVEKGEFGSYYFGFVLIRIMQALGAYGYRGYYEKKSHFLQSIPYAIKNIKHLISNNTLPIEIPELMRVLESIAQSEGNAQQQFPTDRLTVTINSFSYKVGIPQDPSPNGGGFVFDCRALPNPGRYEMYKNLTGKDPEVINYLEQQIEIELFKKSVFALVNQSVTTYSERKFTHLMVNFGCTGGQHRSVYFAEAVAKEIQQKFPKVTIVIHHTQFPKI